MVGEVDQRWLGLRVNSFLSLFFILLLLHIHASMYFIYHRCYIFLSIGRGFNKANCLSLYASQDIILLTQMKEIHSVAILRFVRLSKLRYIYRTMAETCHCSLFWVRLTLCYRGGYFSFVIWFVKNVRIIWKEKEEIVK